jgi:RHS repeat-associated protein
LWQQPNTISSVARYQTEKRCNSWYDGRGNLIKSADANGLFQKSKYDGAGRLVTSYTSFDSGDSSYADAGNVTGDTVIEQTQNVYDPGGRQVASIEYQRLETDTSGTGALTAANSYATDVVSWYDHADRQIASVNYGRETAAERCCGTYLFSDTEIKDSNHNGVPDLVESDPPSPNSSDDYIVSKIEYDAAGRAYRSIDNKGHVTQTAYDALGRTVKTIANYLCDSYHCDGAVIETDTDVNQTTGYEYDSKGRLVTQIAYNPKGSTHGVEQQKTRYIYGSALNGSWVTAVVYPDSSDCLTQDTAATNDWTIGTGCTDHVATSYDQLGRTTSSTDQRGVVHCYTYNSAGQLACDAVTTLPSGVDGSVRRIQYAYDDSGRVSIISSYSAATGGTVVNQITYTYDGWGDVLQSQQAHNITISSTICYAYDDGAVGSAAKYVRLVSVGYAGGQTVYYNYPSSGVGYVLSRLDNIADNSSGTTPYVQYTYLGLGTIVKEEHPAVSGGLTLTYGSAGNYSGWDRFGRIIDQKWTDGVGSTPPKDEFCYTYDRNGNVCSKSNELCSSFSETYSYDGLDRLCQALRDGSNNLQNWTLDALGNWASNTVGTGTAQTRTADAANEITCISGGGICPTYDAAGNMVSASKPGAATPTRQWYVYDGWNRLVAVHADSSGTQGSLIASYEYDGAGRRIQKTTGGHTMDYFYNEDCQNIETRQDGCSNPIDQTIFDIRYVDAPIVRFHDGDTDGTIDNTLYAMQDANFNVTALANASGTVVERYVYTPYGQRKVLEANFADDCDGLSDVDWMIGHQGLALDLESGLIYNRARYLDTSLGRFISRDQLGYVDGSNVYQFVSGNPELLVDPSGFFSPDNHRLITNTALSAAGLAANHGDNGVDGITRAIKRIQERWDHLLYCATLDDVSYEKVIIMYLQNFGEVLHTIQDLYAHSTYVEVMDANAGGGSKVGTIPQWPLFQQPGNTPYIPDKVFSGTFQWPLDNAPLATSHKFIAKDSKDYLRGKVTNNAGVTYFELAKDLAIRATTDAWNQFVSGITGTAFKAALDRFNGNPVQSISVPPATRPTTAPSGTTLPVGPKRRY